MDYGVDYEVPPNYAIRPRHYSMSWYYTREEWYSDITERHRNVTEVRYYAIGRHCTIEGRYYGSLKKAKKLTVEGKSQTCLSQIKLIADITLSVSITL